MRLTGLVPMLQTNEMTRTRHWYETVLGFRCVSAEGETWCRLARDDVSIMFMRNAHLGEPHATAVQYFYVDDVLSLWDSIKHACPAEWGPEEMPYGLTEFAIRDPNGYLLGFGGRVPEAAGMSRGRRGAPEGG
jgi:catechol 2,3-dioxygenase-like lactoylglutathione lyase family enzyme